MSTAKPIIAPSILSADFSRLGEEILGVEGAGCDWIHVDVMDGHFVPNLTIGPPVIKKIRKVTKLPFDVHLMIEAPEKSVDDFVEAGADYLTFHLEASADPKAIIAQIREAGAKPGLSLRPKTPVETLEPYLDLVELILIMTVEPGFGGQAFMPEMCEKVKWVRQRFSGFISVDGGINTETGRVAAESGANVLVAGSAIFSQKDRKSYISQLRSCIA